jgi:paraquat-inducible protein B
VFQGVETEPLSEEPEALLIVLKAPDLGSLQKSSAIFYRGIKVGEVLFFQLAEDSREVVIHARIHQEYKPLVRSNSRFWNAGGIDVHFGLFKGIQVSAESAATLVSGGIEFATPPELADLATNGAAFTLYEKPEDKWKTWMPVIPLKLPRQVSQTNELSNFNLK